MWRSMRQNKTEKTKCKRRTRSQFKCKLVFFDGKSSNEKSGDYPTNCSKDTNPGKLSSGILHLPERDAVCKCYGWSVQQRIKKDRHIKQRCVFNRCCDVK